MGYDPQKDIRSALAGKDIGHFVSDEKAAQLTRDLADKFSFDLTKLFIWANKNAHTVYDYGEGVGDWATILGDLLDRFDQEVFMAVTAEEFYPWKIVQCRKEKVVELLRRLPFFEYFIFDASLQYVVFDTHDNFFLDFIQTWIRIGTEYQR